MTELRHIEGLLCRSIIWVRRGKKRPIGRTKGGVQNVRRELARLQGLESFI